MDRVFPACAGMFLPSPHKISCALCFPRVRGDVPFSGLVLHQSGGFSPRARGCSPQRMATHHLRLVFPACAGMFRIHRLVCGVNSSFPRVRGDVPIAQAFFNTSPRFSPRARGCSLMMRFHYQALLVFPACAGMFPKIMGLSVRMGSFPRVRGDVPVLQKWVDDDLTFSPRARGCSCRHPKRPKQA